MAKYQILYWHEIPVQVRVRDRKAGRASRMLPPRFQAAVDRAAMTAGLSTGDDYTDGFQWSEPLEREGTAQEIVDAVATELEAKYPEINWKEIGTALRRRKREEK